MATRFLPLVVMLLFITVLLAQTPQRQTRYLDYAEAKPLLTLMDEILPTELKGKSGAEQANAWPEWVKSHDAAVRVRLRQGDEDTMINFLLFGMSFTKQPRVTANDLGRLKRDQQAEALGKFFPSRLEDFLRAVADPGKNERLIFLRKLAVDENRSPNNSEGRARLRAYLLTNLLRVLNEQESYKHAIEAARLQGGASEEFIERSRLYRTRGLSLDTTLSPNFAIEQSLNALKAKDLLTANSVKKVGIIGPGLDFTDKASGYDFYPEQTIQPFAVIDSLLRTGLASQQNLRVTAFDLSPRVLSHLKAARQKADRAISYVAQLPYDSSVNWASPWLAYWQTFGDRIGKPAPAIATPTELGNLKSRSVKINPAIVKTISSIDLNIVLQRLVQPEKFDLIIATNILVYYDVFEQSLALSNIESLLRPGGILLSNNALLELPVLKMKSAGYQTTVYSERADDGDHIVWYQRQP